MVRPYSDRQSLIMVVGLVFFLCFVCFFVRIGCVCVCVCISVCVVPNEMCFIWGKRTNKKAISCSVLKTAENNN